jgi:transcriptional regulator with XRE-family HTH domain
MSERRNVSSSLSSQLIGYLKERGNTQADIAAMLGVSEGFVSLVKFRERSLTIDHLELLAEALSVPLGTLLLAATQPAAPSKDARELTDLSMRIMEKADSARRAILRSSTASHR